MSFPFARIIHENVKETKGHGIFAYSHFAPRNLPSLFIVCVKSLFLVCHSGSVLSRNPVFSRASGCPESFREMTDKGKDST